MKWTYLLPFGVGVAALYFLSKAQAGKNIKVYLQGLQLSKNFPPDVFVKFRIVNGSSTPVTIKSIVGDLFVNNNNVAGVSNLEQFTIAGNSETFTTVKVTPSSLSIVQTLWSFFIQRQKIKVSFNGSVNTTGLMIPVNETIYQQ